MTLLLSLKSLGKSYGESPLFQGLSLNIRAGERRGIIGSNGCGKSTLLKVMAGMTEPDQGERVLGSGTRLTYLPQEDRLDDEVTIEDTLLRALGGSAVDDQERYLRISRSLAMAGFESPGLKCGTLSGGWRKRLSIACALIREPDILLLDEPTNHLDITSILWLESQLKKNAAAMVVVSHDRCFLDTVCTRITELGRCFPDGRLSVSGGYQRFQDERRQFLDTQAEKEKRLSNRMRRETDWLRQGPKARTSKARYRIDQARHLEQELSETRKRNRQTRTIDIDFDATHRRTKHLLACHKISKTINGRTLFQDITLTLTPGTCLGLLGPNGSGKTTFMNLLENRQQPDSGTVKRVEGLKTAVFDQTRSALDPEMSLKTAMSPAGEAVMFQGRSLHVTSWAKRFLFTPDQLGLPLRRLSGGERARVLIADLMRQPADLLLLDEPTNDLDIPSLEVLEESLVSFPGAVVIVTHDRFLLERITTGILCFDGKGNTALTADYRQCLSARAPEQPNTPPEKTASEKKRPSGNTAQRTGFSYKHRFELEGIEEKILAAEKIADDLETQTLDPGIMRDPDASARICSELQNAREAVDHLYERWEELEALKEQAELVKKK